MQVVKPCQMNAIVHQLETPGDEDEEEIRIVDDEEDNGDQYDDADQEDTQIDFALTFLDTGQHGTFEILQS